LDAKALVLEWDNIIRIFRNKDITAVLGNGGVPRQRANESRAPSPYRVEEHLIGEESDLENALVGGTARERIEHVKADKCRETHGRVAGVDLAVLHLLQEDVHRSGDNQERRRQHPLDEHPEWSEAKVYYIVACHRHSQTSFRMRHVTSCRTCQRAKHWVDVITSSAQPHNPSFLLMARFSQKSEHGTCSPVSHTL
jgi:hypothetical protein